MTEQLRRLLQEASFTPAELNDFLEQQADEFEQSSGELMDWLREEFSEDTGGDFSSDWSDSDELPF